MPKAMMLVTMEPPANMEDEFNDWYDTEHLPQRLSLPGIETGTRWVCVDGWPRYLALYDLASLGAVETPEYNAVSGSNPTPWSRRILSRTLGRQRIIASQVEPGNALTQAEGVSRLLLARYRGVGAADGQGLIGRGQRGVAQARLFQDGDDLYLVVAFARPVALPMLIETFGEAAGTGADLFNLYAPYLRG